MESQSKESVTNEVIETSIKISVSKVYVPKGLRKYVNTTTTKSGGTRIKIEEKPK